MEKEIKKVRAVIGDDTEEYVFDDDQIEVMLEVEDNIYLASAMLLERVAREEALLYRWLRTDDLTVSGHYGAQVLNEQARALRQQAAVASQADADESFDIVYPLPAAVGRGEYEETRWIEWH